MRNFSLKSIAILLVLIFALGILSCLPVSASDSGSCGSNAYYSYDSSTKTLRIYGTGKICPDNSVYGFPWFEYRQSITTAIVEEGITHLEKTFYGCENLTSVSLPNTLVEIGANTFTMCESLSYIEFPDSLKVIGSGAFSFCSFRSVTIPQNVETIQSVAFSYCSQLNDFYCYNPNTSFESPIFFGPNTNIVVHGYKNSTAHTYAKENDLTFRSLDGGDNTSSPNTLLVLIVIFVLGILLVAFLLVAAVVVFFIFRKKKSKV